MRLRLFVAVLTGALAAASAADAQTPPPAPALVEPAAGAARIQPITLRWNPVVDPDGPIGSYTWQVGTTSSFTTIVLSGFTQESLPGVPMPTQDKVSGLPLGTYFWRVKASQTVGGTIGSIESAWSTVRTFTVSALVAEPGTPSFTSPGNGARFHALEFFPIEWTAVDDAQRYYLLEADDEPSFSYPLTLNTDVMQFGTKFRAGWGNEIPNIYYRVRAVSADDVRGLPSPTLNVKITNTAPVPPAPTLLAPSTGATVSIPFTFDWTDTQNPQDAGYDLDIDDEPNFQGEFGVFLVQNVSRSDYMLAETLAPGNYFWRVRAVHGAVRGPWSAGRSIRIAAGPSTGVSILSIVAAPSTVYGGNSTQARVTLSTPAPAGGVVVKVASDFSQAQTPFSVTIPAGATDATVSPITSVPVPAAAVGTIRAAIAGSWQQSSLGVSPMLVGLELSDESVIGGDALTGTVTLMNPAPPGGIEVTLVSGNTSLITPPAKVSIPAGGFGATFSIATSPVSVPTRVIVDSGTAFEGYRAPSTWLTLMPVVSPDPPPSLSAVTLATSSVPSGGKTTGTVTLTGPAPAGGALVHLNGSMEGTVVTPPNVTVPAGSLSANFPITAPQVPAPHYVLIQASYSSFGVSHARLLEIVPGLTSPTLLGLGVNPTSVVGGASTTGTVQLVVPAPAGGGLVTLTSDNPALVTGTGQRFRSSRQQRDQLHDHHQRSVLLHDGAHRRERGRRHAVRVHQPGDEPQSAGWTAVGDTWRQQRDGRRHRDGHGGLERQRAGGRCVGDARDQQFVGGAGAARRHGAGWPAPGHLLGHHVRGLDKYGGHDHGLSRQRDPLGESHRPFRVVGAYTRHTEPGQPGGRGHGGPASDARLERRVECRQL